MKDLFGNNITEKDFEPVRKTLKKTVLKHYRKSEGKAERCKTCVNIRKCEYNAKTYYKCFILGHSHGPATDIRLSYVCDFYKESR
ncbi:hypothetical protein KAR91_69740 [Candidatus Pacearchaeota archaeon]|nr:hypothetical protein [Candidatus Pacearchaeota archaeon]